MLTNRFLKAEHELCASSEIISAVHEPKELRQRRSSAKECSARETAMQAHRTNSLMNSRDNYRSHYSTFRRAAAAAIVRIKPEGGAKRQVQCRAAVVHEFVAVGQRNRRLRITSWLLGDDVRFLL